MISSSAKSTAATGVLKAAASAPAAPTGTRSLTRAGDSRSQRPTTDARPAPICTDGPSRPIEWPEPMHSTPVMNLPSGTRAGMTPPCRWYAASVCGTPLPRTSGNTFASRTPVTRLTSGGHQQTAAASTGASPKSRWLVAIDGDGEQHGRQSGQDADHDREREEQLVLAQAKLLEARVAQDITADPLRGAGQ